MKRVKERTTGRAGESGGDVGKEARAVEVRLDRKGTSSLPVDLNISRQHERHHIKNFGFHACIRVLPSRFDKAPREHAPYAHSAAASNEIHECGRTR